MNKDLASFAAQCLRTATMALAPVVLTAFLTMPMSLGGHPGDEGQAAPHVGRHMT